MDKIDSGQARLLSRQVVDARYFFHALGPRTGTPCAVAFGGRETCRPDYLVTRKRFLYHGLEYVAEGAGWVELDGRKHTLGPGSVFLYGRETRCVIRTDPGRPLVKYFLCLRGAVPTADLRAAGLRPGAVRTLRSHTELRSEFENLIRDGQSHGRTAQRISLLQFQLILLRVRAGGTQHPRRSGDAAGRQCFLRCKALIDAEAERLVSLRQVAREAGVEASSVCRLFRRYQGTSPYQYLLRRKMTVAAGLLVGQGSLVKEAAQRVGFADPFHFSRCFKAVHGVAPRDLLKLRSYSRVASLAVTLRTPPVSSASTTALPISAADATVPVSVT